MGKALHMADHIKKDYPANEDIEGNSWPVSEGQMLKVLERLKSTLWKGLL